MTDRQYDNTEADLIGRVQAMREAECGARSLVPKETSSNELMDDHDDVYDAPPSSEYQAAIEEFYNYTVESSRTSQSTQGSTKRKASSPLVQSNLEWLKNQETTLITTTHL